MHTPTTPRGLNNGCTGDTKIADRNGLGYGGLNSYNSSQNVASIDQRNIPADMMYHVEATEIEEDRHTYNNNIQSNEGVINDVSQESPEQIQDNHQLQANDDLNNTA